MPTPYLVPAEVVSETLDGQAVVLHLGTGKYFALNGTATRMWEVLSGGGDLDRVVAELAADGTDPGIVHRDLAAFVDELLVRGLLLCATR